MKDLNMKIKKFVNKKNKKIVFTPGPGSLLEENIIGLAPYFGRGDEDYLQIEKSVLSSIKKITGLKKGEKLHEELLTNEKSISTINRNLMIANEEDKIEISLKEFETFLIDIVKRNSETYLIEKLKDLNL